MRVKYSYLSNNIQPSTGFSVKSSYVVHNSSNEILLDYIVLPSEYDVFSQLDFNVLNNCSPDQRKLFDQIYHQITNTLKIIYCNYGVVKPLPKMDLSLDSDGALILTWTYTLFRVYFDIEKNIINSFYGLVIYESDNSIQTKTDLIKSSEFEQVVRQIIQYIFNHI